MELLVRAWVTILRYNGPFLGKLSSIMVSLTETQQAFVRRYMLDERVIGVRIRKVDGDLVLDVEVAPGADIELPAEFNGLPVRVREGAPALLAFTTR